MGHMLIKKKIMKKYIWASGIILTIVACSKQTYLPPYTPPFSKNFSVTSFAHTKDTVNVGDTIYIAVAGTMSDTTQSIYPYITVASSNTNFYYGTPTTGLATAKTPVKLSRVIGSDSSGLYNWSSTIELVGATNVLPNTTLTITGAFNYQLNLSSEGGGTVNATDAGVLKKTVFVQ